VSSFVSIHACLSLVSAALAFVACAALGSTSRAQEAGVARIPVHVVNGRLVVGCQIAAHKRIAANLFIDYDAPVGLLLHNKAAAGIESEADDGTPQPITVFLPDLNIEVAQREAGISHWVAKGPAGTRVEWDARIINDIPNRVIAWQSLEGSMVSTAGSVNFESAPRGTIVRVHFQYNPPAGKVGAAVAWLFGEEPNIQVREDLRRFKEVMEGRQ